MTRAKAGRPAAGQERVHREEILRAALRVLDSAGPQGFSMRALARHLGINPMTLYHHVGDRSALLRALSDRVYAGVARKAESGSGAVRERIEIILKAYHQAVMRHPQLSLGIFETPEAFSGEARRITELLLDLLVAAKLSRAKAKIWLAILVDFTHGSTLAFAIRGSGSRRPGSARAAAEEYSLGLAELLDGLEHAIRRAE